MLKQQNKSKNNRGFTLIEVLIAVSLVAFSLVAILSAFIQQGKINNTVNDMNVAVILAEEKIEEYFKYPYDDMPADQTDYIVYSLNSAPTTYPSASAATKKGGTFERIVTTVQGFDTTRIHVRVNYGYNVRADKYEFNVELETRKGG